MQVWNPNLSGSCSIPRGLSPVAGDTHTCCRTRPTSVSITAARLRLHLSREDGEVVHPPRHRGPEGSARHPWVEQGQRAGGARAGERGNGERHRDEPAEKGGGGGRKKWREEEGTRAGGVRLGFLPWERWSFYLTRRSRRGRI